MKSIKLKLLIFVGIIVLICSGILFQRSYSSVTSNIENSTRQQLNLALNFDLAIREYVTETVRPVMFRLVSEDEFIPETMSTSYFARQVFDKVRKNYPDYIIKFASGNPRNPVNQAGSEELKMIRYFNDNPDITVWTGEIAIGDRDYLATFSAMRMEKACLRCHGNPADAPYELIKRYGSNASFYRPLGEVVGLDAVAIPSDTVKKLLSSEKFKNIGFLGAVILLLSASLIFVFKFVITDRLSQISNHFSNIEKKGGGLNIGDIEIAGKDEIAVLAKEFNDLAKTLNHTYTKLRVEVEERKQAQDALRKSEEKYRGIFDESIAAVYLFDEKKNFLDSNQAGLDLLGYSREELLNMSISDVDANPIIVLPAHEQLLGGERIINYEHGLNRKDGKVITVLNNSRPITDTNGHVIGMQSTLIDITDRKNAQNAMHESEEKYRKLFELESDALALMDAETGNMFDVNIAFIKLYGYNKEEILSKKSTDFSAEPDQTKKNIQNRKERVPLIYHKKKNGTVFPVEITTSYFAHKGKQVLIAAVRDITDRKIIEEQLELSLKEKELLLSEIHHRVKNNFEVISSLLDMSSMTAESQEIKNLLLSSRTRIHSMAMIHSQLYQSKQYGQVDMARHIGELAEHLKFLYKSGKKINLKIEPSEVYLSIKQAIPCALILNELIMNSLKHAFVDREQGKIQISIHNPNDNTVLLRVKDDGAGIPEGIKVKPAAGLGLELVKNLVVGQLKGEVRFSSDDGTDVCIEFST